MPEHIVIDGNNLLHAMHAHAPLPNVGRETLVRVIERWAKRGKDVVTLVFDGPTPHGGLGQQMLSSRITVRFSAPATADDVIVEMAQRAQDPGTVRVVSGDQSIRRVARDCRCRHSSSVEFVAELFPEQDSPTPAPAPPDEKPDSTDPADTERWLETFGYDRTETEPFDGHDPMAE